MPDATPSQRRRWGKVDAGVIAKLAPDFRSIALYALLCTYANQRGETWPKQATLAEQMHVSLPTVRRGLRALEAASLIETLVVVGPGHEVKQNAYRLIDSP